MTGVAAAAPVVLFQAASEAAPAARARKGVVVVGVGASTDAAWPVALSVYGDSALRPKLSDAVARALAGEVDANAPAEAKELAALRAQVKGDDPASRVLLAEIARRAAARAVAVVFPATDTEAIEVRIYDAADDTLSATRHRQEQGAWSALTTALDAKYAPKPVVLAPKPPVKAAQPASGSFLSSPWFWGAVGAAAAAGFTAYLLSRGDNAAEAPAVRVEWGKK